MFMYQQYWLYNTTKITQTKSLILLVGEGGYLFIFNATLEGLTFSFMEEDGLNGATFDEIHAFIHKVCALCVGKLLTFI